MTRTRLHFTCDGENFTCVIFSFDLSFSSDSALSIPLRHGYRKDGETGREKKMSDSVFSCTKVVFIIGAQTLVPGHRQKECSVQTLVL